MKNNRRPRKTISLNQTELRDLYKACCAYFDVNDLITIKINKSYQEVLAKSRKGK